MIDGAMWLWLSDRAVARLEVTGACSQTRPAPTEACALGWEAEAEPVADSKFGWHRCGCAWT